MTKPPQVFQDNEVLLVDGFLSPPRLDLILGELEFAYWWPTEISWKLASGSVGHGVSLGRRSESTSGEWFTDELRREMARLEAQVFETLRVSPSNLECWQAARYGRGGHFDAHLDGGLFHDDPAGERDVTLLLYLNTPRQGGSTIFPELDLEIDARAGRLVAWKNLMPDGTVNPRMVHKAQPVSDGSKIILTTWARQRAIRPSPPQRAKEEHD